MTMSPEAMEQARRALKVFRSLQPVLTTYARVLTGKPDVRVVESASNGSTDGTKIYYRPPLALGRNSSHEKWLCNQRDENLIMRCPACADREQVLSVIYHEIAHIWKESFAETSDFHRKQAVDRAIEEYGGKYAEEIRKRINQAPWSARSTYSGLAALISPYLKMVVNALEDARINLELFRANPGAEIMFAAKTNRIFVQGVEQLDHQTGEYEHKSWKEYPVDAQVVCGLLCLACGYDYSNWFHPDVVAALNDPKLQELVKKTGLLGSMAEVYTQSFPVLARLRELGFCRLPEDPDDEPEPEPEPEQEQQPQPEPEESDEEPDQGDPGDGDPGEGEPQQQDSQGSYDSDEEPGEQEQAEPGSGEPDGDAEEGEDAGDGDESAPGSPGEDQQGDDDSPGGDESGETDSDNESGKESSESDEAGEPGEAGGEGEVGDEDSREAEGSAGTGSETEGPAGGEGGDQELGDNGTDGNNRDDGSSPGGDEGLAEGLPDSGEAGQGDSEVPAGDDPGLGGPPVGDTSGDGADVHTTGDAHDDLGGSEGLDPAPGEPVRTESDGDAGSDAGEGEESDGPDGGEADEADPEADAAPLDYEPDAHGITVNVDENAPEPEPAPDPGSPQDAEAALTKLLDHEKPSEVDSDGSVLDEAEVMQTAIVQGAYFETPSAHINEIHEYDFPEELYTKLPHQCPGVESDTGKSWSYNGMNLEEWARIERGVDGDFSVPQSVIAPSLLQARIVFSENMRGKTVPNLKSGKISARHLGKRAPVDDPRMMRKKLRPSKRSYFVVIGIDVSDSTRGKNIVLAKQLAMAEAELLSRLQGVDFTVIAHGGTFVSRLNKIDIHYYHVKKPNEPWDDRARMRLEKLGPDAINLDGHSMEFYRKILDTRKETDRIIHYYTDGAMPAANFAEELKVLQREIKICRQRGYILRGIGIRTDSPTQHGLETIQLEEQADVLLVIKDLERHLGRRS